MATDVASVMELARALTREQRAELASELLKSLDEDGSEQSDIDRAWRDEIGSRIDDIVRGRVELVDADETYRVLSAELESKRG